MATALRNEGTFRPPTTAEELLLLPDEMHGEIVDGRFVPMTAPGFEHGVVTMRIGRLLSAHAEDHALGLVTGAETAFRLRRSPDLVRCPDCAFVAAARVPPGRNTGAFEGAPDLAVEVLSPSNSAAEMNRKLFEYFQHGTQLVWVVDSDDRSVTIYGGGPPPRRLTDGDTLDGGDVMPGLAIPVARLFAGLPAAE